MKNSHVRYILSLLLFGSNGVIASHIALGSHEIVLMRALIGSLLLLAVFLFSRQRFGALKNRRSFRYLMISGVAMGASWMLVYEAYTRVGVSIATLCYYCGPVIVMAATPIIFRERISPTRWLGFLAVVAGMVFVNARELRQGGLSWGIAAAILSAFTYAIMVIFNKKAVGIVGLENSLLQLSASFVAVAAFTLIRQGVSISIPAGSVLPILLLGLVNTGFGCYLYFSAIPRMPAQSVAVWGYLEPVSALIFSAAFLGERLTTAQWAGTVLILGGAAFSELYRSSARGKKIAA